MSNLKFELLSENHLDQLFAFERENKTWFETWIAPRGEEFYSLENVRAHIESNLYGYSRGEYIPFLLLEGQEIVARANMKEFCKETASAEVGYRVAETHVGKGVASTCLARLIEEAHSLQLKRLRANVLDNNPASRRVLEKQQFVAVSHEPDFWEINGEWQGRTIMELDLSTAGV